MASASEPLLVVHAAAETPNQRQGLLAELARRPALRLLLDRLDAPSTLRAAGKVVLTTDLAADDPIAALADAAGWRTVRGPADDLLAGLSITLVRFPAALVAVVEATGPLGDPHLVAAATELHRRTGVDHTSNLAPRSYPRGLEVEVVDAGILRRCELALTDPTQRNRIGWHLRHHPERYALANLTSGHDLAAEDWSIDAAGDLGPLRTLVAQVGDPVAATWDRILSVGGRARRPRPGDVVLTARRAVASGGAPWVHRWDATRDGRHLGAVTSSVMEGRIETEVQVAEEHREAVRTAFYRLVGADHPRGV